MDTAANIVPWPTKLITRVTVSPGVLSMTVLIRTFAFYPHIRI